MVPALRARLFGSTARLAATILGLTIALGGAASTAMAANGGPANQTAQSVDGVRTEPTITLVQRIARPVVLESRRDSSRVSPKGTDLVKISMSGDYGVPTAALRAYKTAARTMAQQQPACQIPWTLLAGIGRIESDHGRYGGSRLGTDGIPRPAIRGIALNGVGPVAAIHDSDNGRWDGDKKWDRAVGPMQFIPSTWKTAGRDGDGDGIENPNDIDDAALAAAAYLCPASGSILPEASMRAAILSYNHSDYYVDLVMAFERGYRTGVFDIPPPPPPPSTGDGSQHHRRHHRSEKQEHRPAHKPGDKPGAKPGDKPGDKPSHEPMHGDKPSGGGSHQPSGGGSGGHHHGGGKPKPKPSPTPTPDPPAPTYSARSGQLSSCSGGWCLGAARLDFGSKLGAQAAADYDGDGTVETNGQELTGMQGTTVHVVVQDGTTPLRVTQLEGHAL